MTKNGFDFLIETEPDIKLNLQQQQIETFGEATCYKIFQNPRDVSHKFYQKLFDGYEWSMERTLDDLN